MNQQNTLPEWLHYLENLHSSTIDMGLERVRQVRDALGLKPDFPLVIVGGTNGKGSVCAMLSSILTRAGYKVGTYTSPHILHYNERIAINQTPVSDQAIVDSFTALEQARGDVSLTYFEFGTLAAVQHFVSQQVDVAVLEVGLGGRLDAVNVFDADVAVVTNIDIDHSDYLGDTREAIGFEKAGIFRQGRVALCGDRQPPQALLDHAAQTGADLRLIDRDFQAKRLAQQWSFTMGDIARHALPLPALRGSYQLDNAALAIATVEALRPRLQVNMSAIKEGLLSVSWPGRFQVLPGRPQVVLDVGHNPHAVRALLTSLTNLPFARRQRVVFSMLADKDIDTVLQLTSNAFDEWYIAGLNLPRGMSSADLASRLNNAGVTSVKTFETVADAWHAALSASSEDDRIVVFGSFHTVAEVQQARQQAQ